MIEWRYLTGILDGEGLVALYIYKQHPESKWKWRQGPLRYLIKPRIAIINWNENLLNAIETFLANEEIAYSRPNKSPASRTIRLTMFKEIKKFAEKAIPYSIVKVEELRLMKKAIEIYEQTNLLRFAKITPVLKQYAKIALDISRFKSNKGSGKKYLHVINEILQV